MSVGARVSESWTVLGERRLLKLRRLSVMEQHVRLPDGREVTDYLRFTTAPFVVIFAITAEDKVIVERHYKHGPGRVILTFPAGGIEDGESAQHAAARELLEETGYSSPDWQELSVNLTHANAQGSVFQTFLARNCRKSARPSSDDLEQIAIEILSLAELLAALTVGHMPVAADGVAAIQALLRLGMICTI
jgi:ADP-ribose pyrophosphatase